MNSSVTSASTTRREGKRYTGRGRGRPQYGSPAEAEWEREHNAHKQRLLHLRPQVDTSTPECATAARAQRTTPRNDQAARAAQIQEENMRLLGQLETIQRSSSKSRAVQSAPWQDHNRAAASQRRRNLEQERIAKENMRLLKRMESARPTYSREKQLSDFRQSKAIGERISHYTRADPDQTRRSRQPSAGARKKETRHSVAPSTTASSRFRSVSAYSAVSTDSDTESEDGWLEAMSAIMERYQPTEHDPTTVEKEEENKVQLDDAKKLRKALGELHTVVQKAMKNCQGLGIASEDLLSRVASVACDEAPTCTDAVVQSWARSATREFDAFRDSGAFLRFQRAIYSQMTEDLLTVKDHAKAVYVIGKERRDARDRYLKLASRPVNVSSENDYRSAQSARDAFTDLDKQFEDDFRSLREHHSSQMGLSLQVVLTTSADYFDGIAAAMRRTACFEGEPWWSDARDATTKKKGPRAPGEQGICTELMPPDSVHAIPHPPLFTAPSRSTKRPKGQARTGTRYASGDNGGDEAAAVPVAGGGEEAQPEAAPPLYSKRLRSKGASSSRQQQHDKVAAAYPDSAISGGSTTTYESTRTVDLDPSERDTRPHHYYPHSTAAACPDSVDDRLRTKPDPDLPPPSPSHQPSVDVTSRLRVKPEPELPPSSNNDHSVDDRLVIKPPRPDAVVCVPPSVTVAGVPMIAPVGDEHAGDAPRLPEAEIGIVPPADTHPCFDVDVDEQTDSAMSRPPPSDESRSRVRKQFLKKGFSDYLRALSGNDTSEWGLHPK